MLFYKVFQRNEFLLTSLTINQHTLASKFELYSITNIRARLQPFQTATFSWFKRWIIVRDSESQFDLWILQNCEFSLGPSLHIQRM